jgi:hypothetical protein
MRFILFRVSRFFNIFIVNILKCLIGKRDLLIELLEGNNYMTYREIVRAIESLSLQERDNLLQSLGWERGKRGEQETPAPTQPITNGTGMVKPAQLLDEDAIYAVDRDGNRREYKIEDLIWNPQSYDYIKNQSHSFKLALPELIHEYAGKIVDSDLDRDILLDRVCETDFYKQREAIYCELVPERLEINA